MTNVWFHFERKSFCYRRLTYLSAKFQLHVLLNEMQELALQKCVPHRDFYNIRKVCGRVSGKSCSSLINLFVHCRQFRSTLTSTPRRAWIKNIFCVSLRRRSEIAETKSSASTRTARNWLWIKSLKRWISLPTIWRSTCWTFTRYVMEEWLILCFDNFLIWILFFIKDRNTFHRFDKFNAKYNPIGESRLREVFLKTDNYVKGKYFAEVIKVLLSKQVWFVVQLMDVFLFSP